MIDLTKPLRRKSDLAEVVNIKNNKNDQSWLYPITVEFKVSPKFADYTLDGKYFLQEPNHPHSLENFQE